MISTFIFAHPKRLRFVEVPRCTIWIYRQIDNLLGRSIGHGLRRLNGIGRIWTGRTVAHVQAQGAAGSEDRIVRLAYAYSKNTRCYHFGRGFEFHVAIAVAAHRPRIGISRRGHIELSVIACTAPACPSIALIWAAAGVSGTACLTGLTARGTSAAIGRTGAACLRTIADPVEALRLTGLTRATTINACFPLILYAIRAVRPGDAGVVGSLCVCLAALTIARACKRITAPAAAVKVAGILTQRRLAAVQPVAGWTAQSRARVVVPLGVYLTTLTIARARNRVVAVVARI